MRPLLIVLGSLASIGFAQSQVTSPQFNAPPQSVFINPGSFVVLPENTTFRTDVFTQHFNPTSTQAPFFQIFDPGFLPILGPNPSIREIVRNDSFSFAHEAAIYSPETDEVFVSSDTGGVTSDIDHNNQVSKINMAEVEQALKEHGGAVNVTVTPISLPESVQMTKGGTGPFRSNLVFANAGRGLLPSSITLVNPKPPYNATVLVNNYYGRQFNSLNDVKVHPSGKLFFTDDIHGFLKQFRGPPLIPNQVYRLDPDTGVIRTVATTFDRPNGIAFTKDGMIAYVSDTGASRNPEPNDQTRPATIFAFDVDPQTHVFKHRRIFAFVDTGTPDGLHLDSEGNVYASCGDGIQVFAPDGRLLGKMFTNMRSASLTFAPPDRWVILADTRVFVAKIAAKGIE